MKDVHVLCWSLHGATNTWNYPFLNEIQLGQLYTNKQYLISPSSLMWSVSLADNKSLSLVFLYSVNIGAQLYSDRPELTNTATCLIITSVPSNILTSETIMSSSNLLHVWFWSNTASKNAIVLLVLLSHATDNSKSTLGKGWWHQCF